MSRIAIVFCLIFCAGCSDEADPNTVDRGSDAEAVVDGGTVENADRDTVESYFVALGNVQSAREEEKLLTEFGEWLRKSGYKIRVEEKQGRYVLSCPYFPPVTPWADHTFFDAENLELLPRLDDGE